MSFSTSNYAGLMLALMLQAPVFAMAGSAEGHGLFEDAVSTATVAPARSVAIGDVNGDDLNDVLVLTGLKALDDNSYKLFVYHQDIEGNLLPPVKLPATVSNGNSLDTGDFNGDGRTDVVAGGTATGGIFYQTTTGSLAAMVPFTPPQAMIVCAGDFNADGRDDIASLNWSSSSVYVSLQSPGGTMLPAVEYQVSHGGFDELAAGDLNNDGRDDIAIMSGSGNFPDTQILLQSATGTMNPPTPYLLPTGVTANGMTVGDITGDGMHDLLVTHGVEPQSARISIFNQAPSGGLDFSPANIQAYYGPDTVRVADVNRDNRGDLVVLYGGSLLGIHTQTTTGSLNAEVRYPLPYATSYPGQAMAIGDINRDGGLDVAVADYLNGLTILYHTPVHTAANKSWHLYE